MCPVTCQQIGAETLVFAMVSVASDVIFMLWWVGVAFMTNLRIGISGAHGCQKLFIVHYFLLLFQMIEPSQAILFYILQLF